MSAFSQVVTTIGLAKIAAALAGGDPVEITEVAIGDADTTPAVGLTDLGNEVWRGDVNTVDPVEGDLSRVLIETIVPAADGGWTMREAGAFDYDGDMILIARFPDAYKPDPLVDGASVVAYLRLTVEVANAAAAFTLTVDASTVMATRGYVDDTAVDPLESHLDGGASKHDASEIDDETAGGYHGGTAKATLDALNTGLVGHLDGGANKHDATEIDYEQSDPATRVEYGGINTVQAALQILSRALPVAVGIFKLADGADALVSGAGWDGVAPITGGAIGYYKLKLSHGPRDMHTPATTAEAGLVVVATVGAHSAGFVGSYAFELDPANRGVDEIELQIVLPEAHGVAVADGGAVQWAADPAANDSDGVRLSVVVYGAVNFYSALPALYVLTP